MKARFAKVGLDCAQLVRECSHSLSTPNRKDKEQIRPEKEKKNTEKYSTA